MATAGDNKNERRTRTQDMVDKWLEERQELFVKYGQLAGLESLNPERPEKILLRDFCQVLMDYMAFGHFEVYDRISRGEERRSNVLSVAQAAYPRLTEVTELAVAFNDKYDLADHEQSLENLDSDLSRLGEELANRVELEDQLIAALTH